MKKGRKHFSLQFHITLLFLLSMAAVAILLVLHNQRGTRQIILSTTDTLVDTIASQVRASLSETHGPAYMAVSLLGRTNLAKARTPEQRAAFLPLMAQVLVELPHLSAIQIGYANGDYFILRPLNGPRTRQAFHAPAQAAYLEDQVFTSKDKRFLQRRFYDRNLKPVGATRREPTTYDPRARPWYREALTRTEPILSDPYPYFFRHQVGVTVARSIPGKGAVVAADLTLDALSRSLPKEVVTPSSEVVLYDDRGRVYAHHDASRLVWIEGDDARVARLDELGSLPLSTLAHKHTLFQEQGVHHFFVQKEPWSVRLRRISTGGGRALNLAVVIPDRELMSDAHRISKQGAAIGVGIALFSIPLLIIFARRVSLPLHRLAAETERIQRFEFGDSVLPPSRITEVRQLEKALRALKQTTTRFLHLIATLAEEQDFDRILSIFCHETREASNADAVGVMLLDQDRDLLLTKSWTTRGGNWNPLPERLELSSPEARPMREVLESRKGRLLRLQPDRDGWFGRLPKEPTELQLYLLPLLSRSSRPLGVVFLVSTDRLAGGQNGLSNWQHFVATLSGFAAVTLETRALLDSRKALLDSFIQVIAAAIDAKSPYTGGHCQRVPELTLMLHQAAAESDAPAFRDFNPGDEEREALQIAAWLHDCGKVTTPEFVVDKATRLETLYNRIHEIRTRFEVLKRDAWIRYWKGVAEGEDEAHLKQELEQTLATLDEEFAFVAACNSGEEAMTPEKVERLKRIGNRTWTRTLDDTLGLSEEELARKRATARASLPVEEPLLADRPEHLIPWNRQQPLPESSRWHFQMNPPEYRLHLGEIHNLSIPRGTLTEEERFLINQHIVQTMVMLGRLPYPRYLKEVPEIAGAHHEKMDGSGYPLGLSRDQIPLPGRMMAIADIFEALTAADRPYKPAKKLSEAVHILWSMKEEGHIDPDLFDLFLRSGIYRRYAEIHLEPEQIDEVKIENYLTQ